MTPLLSIITVTYNASETLRPTMESLAAQTWGDFEHIVVDGASTDGTVQLARELALPCTRIVSRPDNGLYDAMNRGLQLSRGSYVMFLNAGDSLHDADTLRLVCEAVNSGDERPGIVYGQTCLVSGPQRRFAGMRHLSAPATLTFGSFANGMLVCHQAMAVARDICEPYDLRYRFSADYDWVIRCLLKSHVNRYIDAVIIDYLDEGVTTANHKASLRERYDIMCRYYGKFPTAVRHLKFAARHLWRRLAPGCRQSPPPAC